MDAHGIRAMLIRAEGRDLSRAQARNCNRTP